MSSEWNEAQRTLKSEVKRIGDSLNGGKYLVGGSLSLADVLIASALVAAF